MSAVSIPFSANALSDWQAQLQKELKENTALLQYESPVEELSISLTELEGPQLPNSNAATVAWKRMFAANASNEKQSNRLMREALMQGADALYIVATSIHTNYQLLLAEIEVAYISCLICFDTPEAHAHFMQTAAAAYTSNCILLHRAGTQKNTVSSFAAQQVGANSSTQLAVALFELQQLLEQNPQQKTIYFEMGVGNEYLIEIAKFRAVRHTVSELAKIHGADLDLQLLVKTGFCNKSLQDPYTNLLRLSTEGLSAVLGGAQFLCIQPYDALAQNGATAFGQRMALNIANLINEEAHLATLQDPLQNAYVVEQVCMALVKKAWGLLCEFDEQAQHAEALIKKQIEASRKLRIAKFKSGENILIGINAYPNEFESPKAEWGEIPVAYGFPYLIFEKNAN